MPRLDYSGSCPSLLLEPQRSNSLTHSEYFGGLTIQELTAEYNSIASPSGFQDAVKFTDNSNNARHRILKEAFASSQNDPSTCSVFAKKGTARYAFLTASNGNQVCTIVADLEDGIITHEESATSATHKDIEDYGNGWYRITLAIAGGNSTTSRYWQCGISPSAVPTNYIGNIPTYSGSGDYLYLYGGQQELNASYPTSYIPTYGTSQTRSFDSCLATSVSDLIGQGQGTMFVDLTINNISGQTNDPIPISLKGSGSTNSYIALYDDGRVQAVHYGFGSVQANINLGFYGLTNGRHKFAFVYSDNDFKLYIDGALAGVDTTGLVDAQNDVHLGYYNTSFNGAIKNHQSLIFPTALTDSECIALTSI